MSEEIWINETTSAQIFDICDNEYGIIIDEHYGAGTTITLYPEDVRKLRDLLNKALGES